MRWFATAAQFEHCPWSSPVLGWSEVQDRVFSVPSGLSCDRKSCFLPDFRSFRSFRSFGANTFPQWPGTVASMRQAHQAIGSARQAARGAGAASPWTRPAPFAPKPGTGCVCPDAQSRRLCGPLRRVWSGKPPRREGRRWRDLSRLFSPLLLLLRPDSPFSSASKMSTLPALHFTVASALWYFRDGPGISAPESEIDSRDDAATFHGVA